MIVTEYVLFVKHADLIKTYVKNVINEAYDDIVEVIVKIRVGVTHNYEPTMLDILTDIRGLPNVITVKQVGELGSQDINDRQFVFLRIKYIEKEKSALKLLLNGLKSVNGIDLARLMTREGQRLVGPSTTV
jgi:hypothetical protein